MGMEFLASCMANEKVELRKVVLLPLAYVRATHP
jgi:hypothetical protein